MQVLFFVGPALIHINRTIHDTQRVAAIVQVIHHLIGVDEIERRELDFVTDPYNAHPACVGGTVRAGGLCLYAHYCVSQVVTFITLCVGPGVERDIHPVTNLFDQNTAQVLSAQQSCPIGVYEDGGFSIRTLCGKSRNGIELAGPIHHDQLDASLAGVQALSQLAQTLSPGCIGCLFPAIENLEDFLVSRLVEKLGHFLLSQVLCLQQCLRNNRLGVRHHRRRVGHGLNRICHRRPIKHEARLERHQAAGAAGQSLVFFV